MKGDVEIADLVKKLGRDNLLPAILFRTSRRQCDTDIERALREKEIVLPEDKRKSIREHIKKIGIYYEFESELIVNHPQYQSLVTTGIGAHHAGQLLMWRLILEELMAAGLLRVLVATGTVAAGVDFPARSVVITAHSRRGAEGFRKLTAAELQQMSGRAGRRGKDTVGFCIAAPAPFCDARVLFKIAKRPAEPLVSAYFPSPSTVLNLLRYRNVDDLRFTVERSLAAFKDRKDAEKIFKESEFILKNASDSVRQRISDPEGSSDLELSKEEKRLAKSIRRHRRKAEELEKRQGVLLESSLGGLRDLGYIERLELSEKGYWAAELSTSLVLELAELIESGIFQGADPEEVGAIVAAICADAHRSYLSSKKEVIAREKLEVMEKIVEQVKATNIPGVYQEREVVSAAAHTVLSWMDTESWQRFRSLLVLAGVAEGDAARLITQTADHLNQISRLSETHPDLARNAEIAKNRILRPPLSEAIVMSIEKSE